MARRATKIAEERAKDANVLVLDAGDSLMGDRDPAHKTQGASSIEAMNRLGYDAMTLGPADLALGLPILRQRITEAKFPVLSANAVDSVTSQLIAKPYVIRDLDGHRVAIVGLSGGGNTSEITVREPLATARAIVPEAKSQANEVILLSHAGEEVDRQIADNVPGIAAIIGGGVGASATPWVSKTTGTPVFHADEASAGHAGRIIGVGRLSFDSAGKLAGYKWQQTPLDPTVRDDPDMLAWVQQQMSP